MRIFKRYLFPALYGLVVYFTIRLLNDSSREFKFWRRPIYLNLFEITVSIIAAYIGIFIFDKLFLRFERKRQLSIGYKTILQELMTLVICNLVFLDLIFIPLAAFTDDGLSWGDIVDINLVPALYAAMYYGVRRSKLLLNAYIDHKLQIEKITNSHLETELKFLKAQYHPHFLFNALNSIYFQMDEDIHGAKKSIEKFSDLLRYQLYDQQLKVPVHKEIEYLRSYIELQKLRANSRLDLQVHFAEELENQLVYPLLFLPLVENAFKYLGADFKISVQAGVCGSTLYFRVENSFAEMKSASHSGGIGLQNLQRRLNLLYKDRYELNLQRSDLFSAELKIKYE